MCFVNYVLVLYKLAFANSRFSCCEEETNVSYCDIYLFFCQCACCFLQQAFLNPCIYYLSPGKYLMLETFVNVCSWLNRIDY